MHWDYARQGHGPNFFVSICMSIADARSVERLFEALKQNPGIRAFADIGANAPTSGPMGWISTWTEYPAGIS